MREIATADWSWINAAAERFERAAKEGRRPRIEDFLADVGQSRGAALLDELLRVELELRRRAGEKPTADEYRSRFPDHIAVIDVVFGQRPVDPGHPEVRDQHSKNGSSGAKGGPDGYPLPFQSTNPDLLSPAGPADLPLKQEGVPSSEAVSFHDADTWPPQEVPGSTVTAPSDGAPPLTLPRPGMPGWRVGRYLLVERLGGGNQGHVWRAVELEPIVRSVALKILPLGLAPDDERVERLRKEAKRGGGLSHPAILPVFDYGSCDGHTFLAMQLVEGFPLSNLLSRRRAWLAGSAPADLHRLVILPEADYIRAMVQMLTRVARALAHAHSHRIVHRDVKPSNILIERADQERVFLSDFGLARDLNDLTTSQSSSWVGTLPYMGPEKLRGERHIDEIRSDGFALGVTLFESLTLSRPIELPDSLSALAAAARLANAEPRRPRSLVPRLPRDLEAVILKSIDRNPALRYPTAGELADDLDRFLAGEPVRARPPGWARQTYRRLARHRVALSIVGVLVLIATTALLVRWVIAREHARRAVGYRRIAESRLRAGRLDEADELAAVAQNLVPGDPATADLLDRLRSERNDALEDEIDRGDLVRAWRDWKKLRPVNRFDRERFDRVSGLQPVRVVSERPGTRVIFHARHPDGRPKDGPPLYELIAGPKVSPSEDLNHTVQVNVLIIPGAYWVTAYVEGTDAFVERPFEVRRDRTTNAFSHTLRLYPKTTRDASAGMVEIPGGTLKMGSNETLPAVGLYIQAPAEHPEHEVPVRDFYLDRTEVTNRAFLEFLTKTGRTAWGPSIWPETKGRPDPAQLDWPVTQVIYEEAVEFAAWRGCCLPDEPQLEWAARGPNSLKRPKNVPEAGPIEPWTRLHAVDSDPLDLTDIWSKAILGLYGNAGELTLFRIRPYPNQVRSVSGSLARDGFAVRSGAFHNPMTAKHVSLGYLKRASLFPESRNDDVGFRCARSIAFRINVLSQPLSEE